MGVSLTLFRRNCCCIIGLLAAGCGAPGRAGNLRKPPREIAWLAGTWNVHRAGQAVETTGREVWRIDSDSSLCGTYFEISGADTVARKRLELRWTADAARCRVSDARTPVVCTEYRQIGETWHLKLVNYAASFPQIVCYEPTSPDSVRLILSGMRKSRPLKDTLFLLRQQI